MTSTASDGQHLDFEEPLVKLSRKLSELKADADANPGDVAKLEKKLSKTQRDIFSKLTPWQRTKVARHPRRPYTLDYVRYLFQDFVELHGDRKFGDDPAIVAGFAQFCGRSVAVIGHQKGRDTKQKLHRNFGMPRPEGYRKACRVMEMADKFRRPIITFIDTPGAYPGIGAEERGQAEAIAYNLKRMAALTTPCVVAVTGEGGSGGALAIGVGDRVLMLESSIYSVISPEACSSILFKTNERAAEAADALKLTARDLFAFDIVDEIVPEPPGGAHSDPKEAARLLGEHVLRALEEVERLTPEERREQRYLRFRRLGQFEQPADADGAG